MLQKRKLEEIKDKIPPPKIEKKHPAKPAPISEESSDESSEELA